MSDESYFNIFCGLPTNLMGGMLNLSTRENSPQVMSFQTEEGNSVGFAIVYLLPAEQIDDVSKLSMVKEIQQRIDTILSEFFDFKEVIE